jgi:hypothetical protein
MESKEYNGYYNFATWQFCLNINNSEYNMNYIKENKKELLMMDDEGLLNNLCLSLEFWDKPDMKNIYIPEIRKIIEEE